MDSILVQKDHEKTETLVSGGGRSPFYENSEF